MLIQRPVSISDFRSLNDTKKFGIAEFWVLVAM